MFLSSDNIKNMNSNEIFAFLNTNCDGFYKKYKFFLGKDHFDELLMQVIDKVKACIRNHRGSVVNQKLSIEEICVADADAMSHLDSVVELICWRAYLGEDIMTANDFVKGKIIKSYSKMSKPTQELMKDKYESIMKVLF